MEKSTRKLWLCLSLPTDSYGFSMILPSGSHISRDSWGLVQWHLAAGHRNLLKVNQSAIESLWHRNKALGIISGSTFPLIYEWVFIVKIGGFGDVCLLLIFFRMVYGAVPIGRRLVPVAAAAAISPYDSLPTCRNPSSLLPLPSPLTPSIAETEYLPALRHYLEMIRPWLRTRFRESPPTH